MSAPDPELKPSEARLQVLREHVELRKRLERLRQLADALESGAPDAGRDLHDALQGTRRFFFDHLALEERIVAPHLAQTDAFSEVRVDAMLREHQEQRAMMDTLCRAEQSLVTGPFLAELRDFIDTLLADMVHEEKTHLSPRILKDDVIPSDPFGG